MSEKTKIKLATAISSLKALKELNENKNIEFNTSYKIAKLNKSLEPHVSAYQETVNEYIKSNGKETKDGGYTLEGQGKEVVEKFSKHVNDILNEEISIDLSKINIDELKEIKLSPSSLTSLMWLINE